MRDEIQVRRVRADELNALTEQFTSEFERTHRDDLVDQAAGDLSFFAAWAGRLPVGHVLIRWRGPRSPEVAPRYPDCPELYRLSVVDAYQRRGIGSKLIATCEGEARAKRRAAIGLGVVHANPQARRLYEKLGYAASSITSYEDSYRVRDASGEALWIRCPCAWLTKELTPMRPIETRSATAADAEEAVLVLRESIRKLCGADHRNDGETLALWRRNKTIDDFLRWLSTPDSSLIVAGIDGHVRGVAAVHASGQIRLCYVQPGFEGLGIGGALLEDLEERARSWGVQRLRCNSSLTAQGFYERHGYVRDGEPIAGFGVAKGYPYAKALL